MMRWQIEYRSDWASAAQIADHLTACDAEFVPPLASRVDVRAYAEKIRNRAITFEAWAEHALVGLVAAYLNDQETRCGYVTSVSVKPEWAGKGVASELLGRCVERAKSLAIVQIDLRVDGANHRAITLYERNGFVAGLIDSPHISMRRLLDGANTMNTRDYNAEIEDTTDHKYAYGFDFDVMHPYMIKSFEPFFLEGSLLELGSFKGDFTKRLLPHFDDVTCVEASNLAISEAKDRFGDKVTFVNSLFETAKLPNRYNNIILTHVLEHLDDPVLVLKRINDEWLAPNGRLFLVCPNANAPSRQIAVKMGLISHNSAVTAAEAAHGHRRTYSLDTLERDASAAGLKVVHRSGIFFKALANFQWDRLLQTDIISKDYLDGCYSVGQQYPDLCSSVFLLCQRS